MFPVRLLCQPAEAVVFIAGRAACVGHAAHRTHQVVRPAFALHARAAARHADGICGRHAAAVCGFDSVAEIIIFRRRWQSSPEGGSSNHIHNAWCGRCPL